MGNRSPQQAGLGGIRRVVLFSFSVLWLNGLVVASWTQGLQIVPDLSGNLLMGEAVDLEEEDDHEAALKLLEFALGMFEVGETGDDWLLENGREEYELLAVYVGMLMRSGADSGDLEAPLFRMLEIANHFGEAFASDRADLEHLFALWLLEQGALADGATMLQAAIVSSLSDGAIENAIDYLLAVAEVYSSSEDWPRLRQTWSRIDLMLVERLNELGNETLLRAYLYRDQAEKLLRERGEAPLEDASQVDSRAVDLQPEASLTVVAVGEAARSRATLTNTSSFVQDGKILVRVPKGFAIEWESVGLTHRITLVPKWWASVPQADFKEVVLPPSGQVRIYLECRPAEDSMVEAELSWQPREGAEEVVTTHKFQFAPDRRPAAFVNAVRTNWHTSYSVPIHCELLHRAQRTLVHDFRIVSDVDPCRIEYYEELTGKLLAIDSDGNGNFDGEGDQVWQDSNGDGYPDFVLSKDEPLAGIEILAFPSWDAANEVELALSFHSRRRTLKWKALDINYLQIHRQ